MILSTRTKTFGVFWASARESDGEFRASIKDGSVTEIFRCFTDETETQTLTVTVDDILPPREYAGFTNFVGVTVSDRGIIVVMRRKHNE